MADFKVKKHLPKILGFISTTALVYLLMCFLLFIFQEKLIFHPSTLPANYRFVFEGEYEELKIPVEEDIALSALHFTGQVSRGVILYLHGNAGNLSSWGNVAKYYTEHDYDVFMIDYRGFGKSDGQIESAEQLFRDNQKVYDLLTQQYGEYQIIVLGYSIGSGMAARLGAENRPQLVILQAPYYSLSDLVRNIIPIIPSSILKYRIPTYQYLRSTLSPVVLFHGTEDQTIYYGSSLKLQKEFKSGDTLITLQHQDHNNYTSNPDYLDALAYVINNMNDHSIFPEPSHRIDPKTKPKI